MFTKQTRWHLQLITNTCTKKSSSQKNDMINDSRPTRSSYLVARRDCIEKDVK